MLHFFYGRCQTYLDITDTVLRFCCDGRHVHIPTGDRLRATMFSDPAYGHLKEIVVISDRDLTLTCTTFPHDTPVDLPVPAGLVPPARSRPVLAVGPVDEIIARERVALIPFILIAIGVTLGAVVPVVISRLWGDALPVRAEIGVSLTSLSTAALYGFVINKGLGTALLGKASFTARYGR